MPGVRRTLAVSIRSIQDQIIHHRSEIDRLNGELDEARQALSGDLVSPPTRSRPIRKTSSVGHAVEVLRDLGQDMDADPLVATINERFGSTVTKTTLVSSLSRYVRAGDTFTRPRPGAYGLIEFKERNNEAATMSGREETMAS